MKKETGRWKNRWKIRDLLADETCSRAVLDFLSTTDVGRQVPAEENEAVSAVSEMEVQRWLERWGAEAEELGGEEPPLFLPTPDFMAPAGADPGAPVQRMHRVEAAAESSVGRGEKGDREVEGPMKGAGPHG